MASSSTSSCNTQLWGILQQINQKFNGIQTQLSHIDSRLNMLEQRSSAPVTDTVSYLTKRNILTAFLYFGLSSIQGVSLTGVAFDEKVPYSTLVGMNNATFLSFVCKDLCPTIFDTVAHGTATKKVTVTNSKTLESLLPIRTLENHNDQATTNALSIWGSSVMPNSILGFIRQILLRRLKQDIFVMALSDIVEFLGPAFRKADQERDHSAGTSLAAHILNLQHTSVMIEPYDVLKIANTKKYQLLRANSNGTPVIFSKSQLNDYTKRSQGQKIMVQLNNRQKQVSCDRARKFTNVYKFDKDYNKFITEFFFMKPAFGIEWMSAYVVPDTVTLSFVGSAYQDENPAVRTEDLPNTMFESIVARSKIYAERRVILIWTTYYLLHGFAPDDRSNNSSLLPNCDDDEGTTSTTTVESVLTDTLVDIEYFVLCTDVEICSDYRNFVCEQRGIPIYAMQEACSKAQEVYDNSGSNNRIPHFDFGIHFMAPIPGRETPVLQTSFSNSDTRYYFHDQSVSVQHVSDDLSAVGVELGVETQSSALGVDAQSSTSGVETQPGVEAQSSMSNDEEDYETEDVMETGTVPAPVPVFSESAAANSRAVDDNTLTLVDFFKNFGERLENIPDLEDITYDESENDTANTVQMLTGMVPTSSTVTRKRKRTNKVVPASVRKTKRRRTKK